MKYIIFVLFCNKIYFCYFSFFFFCKKKLNILSNIDGGSKGFDMEVDFFLFNYVNDEIILLISL